MGVTTEEEMLDSVSKKRGDRIDLGNHGSGWRALCKLWDNHPTHKEVLERMGYGLVDRNRLTSASEPSIPTTVQKGRCPS